MASKYKGGVPQYTGGPHGVDRITGAGAPRNKKYTPHTGAAGLEGFAIELNDAAGAAPKRAKQIVQKSVDKVQKDWRKFYRATEKYFAAPYYPRAITTTVRHADGAIVGDVGPDKNKKQGPLGNLIEFGSINNFGQHEGEAALDLEREKFVRRIGNMGVNLISGGGVSVGKGGKVFDDAPV